MSINVILIGIVGLIAYTNGDLNDSRCSPRQSFMENVEVSVDNLCREAKLENDTPNYADFIFTYINGSGPGFTTGNGGRTATASVSLYLS
jgi:hypothetical protein